MDIKIVVRYLFILVLAVLSTVPSSWASAQRLVDDDEPDLPYAVALPLILRTTYSPIDLVSTGANWLYQDDGSDLETAWRAPGFDDSKWKSGPAPLGYGGNGEATRLHYGPDRNNKYITYYFRHSFYVQAPSDYLALDLELQCDDGAVVYLNGIEIYRFNMPETEITASTPAFDLIYEAIEQNFYHTTVDAALLTAGENILAVEVHQYEATSSDLGLDLSLMGSSTNNSARFAAIGDYGYLEEHDEDTAGVVDQIKSWNPEFIVTLGDNNYPRGAAETIDTNVGRYFHDFISPYTGEYGPGAHTNRFFPSLGNHDWIAQHGDPPLPVAYLDYFTLPGNERYYDFRWGPVHLFVVDSDISEPDGFTRDSIQAAWLRAKMLNSDAAWQIVYFHTPPFSGGPVRGPTPEMDWPFAEWGADLVMSGHTHNYQRIQRYGINYIVNGAGGFGLYGNPEPVEGMVSSFASDYGAMLLQATPCQLTARFIAQEDSWVVDAFRLTSDAAGCR